MAYRPVLVKFDGLADHTWTVEELLSIAKKRPYTLAVRTTFFILVFLLPVAAVSFFHGWINKHYADWEGTVAIGTFLASAYISLFTWFYYRSETLYLFVNRLWLWAGRVHTTWRFTASFTLPTNFSRSVPAAKVFSDLLDSFKKEFPNAPIQIESLTNACTIIVDNRDRYKFSLGDDPVTEVSLITSKQLVPGHLYQRTLDNLSSLFGKIEKVFSATESVYMMDIEFEKNPFFGFFIRNMPAKFIEDFRCSFKIPSDSQCRIETSATALHIHCRDAARLFQSAKEYLNLTGRIMSHGS